MEIGQSGGFRGCQVAIAIVLPERYGSPHPFVRRKAKPFKNWIKIRIYAAGLTERNCPACDIQELQIINLVEGERS